MNYLYQHNLPGQYGAHRRQVIKQWFQMHPDGAICINNKWQIQLKHDPDLRRLIKDNILKQVRQDVWGHPHAGGWKTSGKRQTLLIKC